MTRINTNLSSLTAQHILGRSSQSLQTSLTRLSTGLRINSGKDDPGGLIASEILRSEIVSISQSISNSERANNIVATADAALAQVSTLLNDVRGLVQAAANKGAISSAEIAANQVQLDSALESIARIGQTTVFGGDKLLNGTKSFTVNATGGSLGVFQSSADLTISSFDPALHTAAAGDDVTITTTQVATKRTTTILGDDFALGDAEGLFDLSLGTSTRTTATLVANDLDLGGSPTANGTGNGASLNDLVSASTRAVRSVNFAGGVNGLDDLAGVGANTITLTITGDYGTAAGVVVNAAAIEADITVLRDAINAQRAVTGTIAAVNGGGDLELFSAFKVAGAVANVQATAASVGGDVAAFNNAVAEIALVAGTTGAATPTTFTITGSKGSADVLLANNDTLINNNPTGNAGLIAFRDLINTRTGTTGVTASVSGGNLVLTSSGVGSASLANIAVAAGGDATDIATLANVGTKTVATGTNGTSNTTTVELIGDSGRAVITFNNDSVINDSNALTSAINSVTSQTGITASGSGQGANVVLTSSKFGSAALITANAIAATISADITLFNDSGTQSTVAGLNSAGTITHRNGGGSFSGAGEIISYNDSSLSLTGVSNPALATLTRATTTVQDTTAGAGGLDSLTGTGVQTISFNVTGALGTVAINNVGVVALKADSRVLRDLINAQSGATGVRAIADTASSSIVLEAVNSGSGGSVSIVATASTNGTDHGVFNNADTLTGTVAGSTVIPVGQFDVTGGALFQIGPTVNFANQVNVNITSLDLATLGRNFTATGNKGISALKTGGTDVLATADLSTAASLVSQAISQISTLRGQLGALQKNVLESNIASQQSTLEQVTAAESNIRDADFAKETAALTRAQILVQAGTSVLAIANSSPQNVLALLQ